jgi:hypothetical protein
MTVLIKQKQFTLQEKVKVLQEVNKGRKQTVLAQNVRRKTYDTLYDFEGLGEDHQAIRTFCYLPWKAELLVRRLQ